MKQSRSSTGRVSCRRMQPNHSALPDCDVDGNPVDPWYPWNQCVGQFAARRTARGGQIPTIGMDPVRP